MIFQGKCVIVTGASRGIGRAIALAFAKEGAHLIINGTNQILLSKLEAEIKTTGLQCISVVGDVASPATAQRLVETGVNDIGRLDCLVNNAGIIRRMSSADMTAEDWQDVLDVNLTGTLHCCRAALTTMCKQGHGKIVNIASAAAKQPHGNAAPSYGASKAGVLYITRHLARDYAPYGININAVCPGPIKSDMTEQWTSQYRKRVMQGIPLGRIGKPEEVAAVVLFLCSEGAGFIAGEAINVNGGTFMD